MPEVTLHFDQGFNGQATAERASLAINEAGKGFVPYELLYSALGSCVHATFLGIAEKMRIQFESMDYHITGVKREEIPTYLVECTLTVTVRGASDQAKFEKAFTLGTEYCSIFNTLKKVATMKVIFIHQ